MIACVVGCNQVTSGPDTVQVSLVVVEGPGKIPLVGLTPLEGVAVCETDTTTNCETTDATGNATLELPSGQNVSWTLVKDGMDRSSFRPSPAPTSIRNSLR